MVGEYIDDITPSYKPSYIPSYKPLYIPSYTPSYIFPIGELVDSDEEDDDDEGFVSPLENIDVFGFFKTAMMGIAVSNAGKHLI